ncbi:hypothetical protein [Streptomyces sp. NPDC006012]|uniref:hypothetical protein n=1 Tax=Streptomyces sp. NPDC006012 TaxID=3364739 RepID=UPI0036768DAD
MREHAADSCTGSSTAGNARDAGIHDDGFGHPWGHFARDNAAGHPGGSASGGP